MSRMGTLVRQCAVLVGFCELVACGGATSDDATGVQVDALTARLPSPKLRRGPIRNLIQARVNEAEALLIRRYEGYRILQTTQTYVGDIVDWVDPTTMPGTDAEPPPVPDLVRADGVEPALTELQAYPELAGPEGTFAVLRPQFLPYTTGASAAGSLTEFIERPELGQPAGQKRLYGGRGRIVDNRGGDAWFNAWAVGSIQSQTFSIMEVNASCPSGSSSQLVGAAISRDMQNFGDSTLRLQVEFRGSSASGWHPHVTGFVQTAAYSPGFAVVPLSTDGGAQYDEYLEVQLFQGNWWVGHATSTFVWLGYYPTSLFTQLNTKACKIAMYGEVFDQTETDWTSDNMGSGAFASAGWTHAAFVRRPSYIDTSSQWQWLDSSGLAAPQDTACYTVGSMVTSSTPGWERYFYLGGPGGDAAGCN
jgi:hypothetical protein